MYTFSDRREKNNKNKPFFRTQYSTTPAVYRVPIQRSMKCVIWLDLNIKYVCIRAQYSYLYGYITRKHNGYIGSMKLKKKKDNRTTATVKNNVRTWLCNRVLFSFFFVLYGYPFACHRDNSITRRRHTQILVTRNDYVYELIYGEKHNNSSRYHNELFLFFVIHSTTIFYFVHSESVTSEKPCCMRTFKITKLPVPHR